MPRFLYLDPIQVGATLTLSKDESHHLYNVLRLREGAGAELIDGKGTLATCRIRTASKHATEVDVLTVHCQRKSRIRLCFGLAKPQSTEFLIRRCTELGVHAFQPLITDHSLREKTWNSGRWARIVEEVCKQCQEAYFPELLTPKHFSEWIAEEGERTIIACDEADRDARLTFRSDVALEIALGAEGGWSESERDRLKSKAVFLGLGVNRLRAETAALVALTLVKDKSGELSFPSS